MVEMQIEPAQLFYEFCLDDHVPADHLLRRIDQFLDLERVRSELRPHSAPPCRRKLYVVDKWLCEKEYDDNRCQTRSAGSR